MYGLTESSPGHDPDPIRRADPGEEVLHRRKGHAGHRGRGHQSGDREFCEDGEHGELCCRGYNVMKGYYKMPEETAKAIDKDGWLHSGDIGMSGQGRILRRHRPPQGHDHPGRGEHLPQGGGGLRPPHARGPGRPGGRRARARSTASSRRRSSSCSRE